MVNERPNFTKPANDKISGLPLADTHYLLDHTGKKCFIYVYEIDGSILVLFKSNKSLFEEIKKEQKHVLISSFPKSNHQWYSLIIDESCDETSLSKFLDKLILDVKT